MNRFLDPTGRTPTQYKYAVSTGMILNGLDIVALTNQEDDVEDIEKDDNILFASSDEDVVPIYLPKDAWLVLWDKDKSAYVSTDDWETNFILDDENRMLIKIDPTKTL